MQRYLPELGMVFVALMYSCLSLATRFMDIGMTANIAFATRAFFGFVIGYTIFALIFRSVSFKSYLRSTPRDWLGYLLMGVFGYAGGVLLISYGVLMTNLFTVAVVFATVPIFVSLFEFLFFKQKIKPLYFLFLVISIVGVGLCSLTIDHAFDISFGALLVLGSAVLSAAYIIGISRFAGNLNPRELGLLLMFIASLAGLVFALISGLEIRLEGALTPTFVLGLLIGASFNIATSVLEPWAFQNMRSVALGSQILLLEVVFSFIFGLVLFAESPTYLSIVGAFLIVGSVAMNNYLESRA